MKKTIILAALFVLSVFLTGCGGSGVKNCGTVNPLALSEATNKSITCFEDALATCTPAKFAVNVELLKMEAKYEITGKNGDKCGLKMVSPDGTLTCNLPAGVTMDTVDVTSEYCTMQK